MHPKLAGYIRLLILFDSTAITVHRGLAVLCRRRRLLIVWYLLKLSLGGGASDKVCARELQYIILLNNNGGIALGFILPTKQFGFGKHSKSQHSEPIPDDSTQTQIYFGCYRFVFH